MDSVMLMNRQMELYQNMLRVEIPELCKSISGKMVGKYKIDVIPLPILHDNEREEDGTLYCMQQCKFVVTDTETGDESEFISDVLKIPVFTSSGFKLRNNHMQVLDLYTRVPGWCIVSDYTEENPNQEQLNEFKARKATLYAINKTSLEFHYQSSTGIVVKLPNRSIPVGIFFRALSQLTDSELLAKYGLNNLYIVSAFDSLKKENKSHEIKIEGRSFKSATRADCINIVYSAMNSYHSSNENARNVADKLRIINRRLFNRRYLDLGSDYANRLETSMSFSLRAIDKVLAEDVIVDGKVVASANTILTREILLKLDAMNVDRISVYCGKKLFDLIKFSTFTFRALGYKLKESVAGISGGKELVLEDLEVLNNSDLNEITVNNLAGEEIVLKRRVRPRTLAFEDLLTVFGIYANILNGFDVSDDQYELTNRLVQTFDKKICNMIGDNLAIIMSAMENELHTSDGVINTLAQTKINTDLFIKKVTDTNDSEGQMSDINNSLHYISKSYKITTDIKQSSATESLRKVQDTQLGRTDSLDSPESNKIGLVHERTLLSKETDEGYLTAPFLRVENGEVVSDEPIYLTAQEELGKYIAEFNENFYELDSEGNKVKKERVTVRYNGNIISVETDKVTLKEYSQLQNMSPARSLIPFMANSNAKRLLMGCNHQKQAIPTMKTERPIVGTGSESIISIGNYTANMIIEKFYNDAVHKISGIDQYRDSILNSTISLAENGISDGDGTRTYTFYVNEVKKLVESGVLDCSPLVTVSAPFMQKTTEKSIYSFRLKPNDANLYYGSDIVIYNMSYDTAKKKVEMVGGYGGIKIDQQAVDTGAYGPGRNLVIAYKTFESSTIDDAICISSRLVYDETLTSISMVVKKVELHNDDKKTQVFGIQSPEYPNLAANGLAKVGSVLHPGDVYACVLSKVGDKTFEDFKRLDEYTQGQVVSADFKTKNHVKYAEIVIASKVDIDCGDKLSSRHGNKGVVGKIVPMEEMPYDPVTGITVDVVLNTLGIPSRMNIGQLLEATLAFVMKKRDQCVTVAPYEASYDYVMAEAEKEKVKPMYLMDGRNGVMFKRPINVGVLYMYKLVHLAKKKITAISLQESVDPVFLQPLKGQKNNGGQSFGEMESWCLQAIGANKVLQSLYSMQSDDVKAREMAIQMSTEQNGKLRMSGDNHNNLVALAYLRSLCIDVSLEDGEYCFSPLTDKKIRSLSVIPVESRNDLHNPVIFSDGRSLKSKSEARENWSYIDLNTDIISPYWLAKGKLHHYIAAYKYDPKVKSLEMFSRKLPQIIREGDLSAILNKRIYVDQTIKSVGYPTFYNVEDVSLARDPLTGLKGLLYVFRNYDVSKTLAVYDRKIDSYEGSHEDSSFVSDLRYRNYLNSFIKGNYSLRDYVISSYPVMPISYRPVLDTGNRRTSDFDKSYVSILKAAQAIKLSDSDENVMALLRDIDIFLGTNCIINDDKIKNERTSVKQWFTGSGYTGEAKHHGKIRENVLSKRIFCSGRSVIIPTSIPDMKPTELGLPISMAINMYKQPLTGYLRDKLGIKLIGYQDEFSYMLDSIAEKNLSKFRKFIKILYGRSKIDYPDSIDWFRNEFIRVQSLIINYLEKDDPDSGRQVVMLGRQPSLHQLSIRAYTIRVVFSKAIYIHPLVCGGYNADFDGDTTWVEALLDADAREEALRLMSPKSIFVNPKDSSLVMMPSQDIALGIYCATMLKDNVDDVYKVPDVLDDVRVYTDLHSIRQDLEMGWLQYWSLILFSTNGRTYYSTAGRILFNSIIPGCFTEDEFENTLNLPIPSIEGFSSSSNLKNLKYDGIIAAKGGTRKELVYYNLESIIRGILDQDKDEIIDVYQQLTEFGFRASDAFSVTLSLHDIKIDVIPEEIKRSMNETINLLEQEQKDGIISESEVARRKKMCIDAFSNSMSGINGEDTSTDVKDQILKQAESEKSALELDYQSGLVSKIDRVDGIQSIYSDAKKRVEKSLRSGMSRNNNLFIIFDSGSRGNIGQIMQTAGTIGILQKTKSKNMEMPVVHNYAQGLSSFEVHISSYAARTGVASTQNETRTAGHATRTCVYMMDGIKIVEDNCGKENWFYDVEYTDFVKILLYPSESYFKRHLLGKALGGNDEAKKAFPYSKDGIVTEEMFEYFAANGICDLELSDGSIRITLDSMRGTKLSEDDTITYKHLKHLMSNSRITRSCIKIIEKAKLKHVCTNVGRFELYYKIDPMARSILIGREAKPEMQYLEKVLDPNTNTYVNVVTDKTIDWIEENRLERVPVRILLDCESKHGVCAHCFGKSFTRESLPMVGSNVGIESAQSLGEPAAQLTMNLVHAGGAAGASIAGGIAVLQNLLDANNPMGKKVEPATIATYNGYVVMERLDSTQAVFVLPDDRNCEMCLECKSKNGYCPYEKEMLLEADALCKVPKKIPNNMLIVEDNEYVEFGKPITLGSVLPNMIPANGYLPLIEVLRMKQINWTHAYYKTFVIDNGIDIHARHFEIMARLQNTLVIVTDSGNTDLEPGAEYEITSLMRQYSPEELKSVEFFFETSKKYKVVTHFSGPLAQLTFEDSISHAALFTNTAVRSDVISPIADIFVGNDLKTNVKKDLDAVNDSIRQKRTAKLMRSEFDITEGIGDLETGESHGITTIITDSSGIDTEIDLDNLFDFDVLEGDGKKDTEVTGMNYFDKPLNNSSNSDKQKDDDDEFIKLMNDDFSDNQDEELFAFDESDTDDDFEPDFEKDFDEDEYQRTQFDDLKMMNNF